MFANNKDVVNIYAKRSFRIVDAYDILGDEPNATLWHRFFRYLGSSLLAPNVQNNAYYGKRERIC